MTTEENPRGKVEKGYQPTETPGRGYQPTARSAAARRVSTDAGADAAASIDATAAGRVTFVDRRAAWPRRSITD